MRSEETCMHMGIVKYRHALDEAIITDLHRIKSLFPIQSLSCDVLKRSDCFVAARSMGIQVFACVCAERIGLCEQVCALLDNVQ